MFQTGLPLLKISMLLEILDFLAEMAAGNSTSGFKGDLATPTLAGIFSYSDPPRAGMPIGCGIAGKENKVFVACYKRHAFGRQARLRIKTSAIDNRSSTFWRARI